MGHEGANTLSLGSVAIPGVGTIYNAERAETLKAALMAGADRETANTLAVTDISDYGAAGFETANGLDSRYGAGQLNIRNSYRILTGSEQNSAEDGGPNGGLITARGFDYDALFGGASGSNASASYFFTAENDQLLRAALVWNVDIAAGDTLAATLRNLDLYLFDLTTGSTGTPGGRYRRRG